jgi:hypothetical protein
MGGLLCKAVIKEFIDSQTCTPRGELAVGTVSGLFLLATPQAGSQRVPRFFAPLTADGRVLRAHSHFVTEINGRFADRVSTDIDGGIPKGRRICIPSYAALATGDIWVDVLSASMSLSRNQIKTVRGTHTSIVKIKSREEGIYSWLTERINSCMRRPQIERLGFVEMMRPEIERVISEPLIDLEGKDFREIDIKLDLNLIEKAVKNDEMGE